MKKHIYWLISIILIIVTVSAFILTVLKIMPAILLLELFFCILILFVANMSSGITYAVVHKNKIRYLIGFTILNTLCIASLAYYGIILAFVVLYNQ